jgi:CHAT domain-containing protein
VASGSAARSFESATYQVVWLISHGEYDHFFPKEARLEIGADGTSVGMDDLLNAKLNLTARRLLVLYVCDGATHPGEGVLPRLARGPVAGNDISQMASLSYSRSCSWSAVRQ